jgi:hypothetical protein
MKMRIYRCLLYRKAPIVYRQGTALVVQMPLLCDGDLVHDLREERIQS